MRYAKLPIGIQKKNPVDDGEGVRVDFRLGRGRS